MEKSETEIPWNRIAGQTEQIKQLQIATANPAHAYFFVGPEGSGKKLAAQVFAASLLTDNFTADKWKKTLGFCLAGNYPDLSVIEPDGRNFLAADAKRVIEESNIRPSMGKFKVIIIDQFHSANPDVAPALLKTVEEPPEGIIVILLSEKTGKLQETVVSRCVKIEFNQLSNADLKNWLEASMSTEHDIDTVVKSAMGSQTRAAVLAADPSFPERLEFWKQALPAAKKHGTELCRQAITAKDWLDKSQAVLEEKQKTELEEIAENLERYGDTALDKQAIEDRHKREIRKFREQELKWGLSIISETVFNRINSPEITPKYLQQAQQIITNTINSLMFNPNEQLALQAMFIKLAKL